MLMLFTGVSLGLLLLKMFYIFCMQIKGVSAFAKQMPGFLDSLKHSTSSNQQRPLNIC